VLRGGNVFMKITNNGFNGNPNFALSSDPSAQWPGSSGVEYLYEEALAVGAVNPFATDPTSFTPPSGERPPLRSQDRMYCGYDGVVRSPLVNDAATHVVTESAIDEDFLDGRDNDGDGKIDGDFAALGQTMYSCVMRDDTSPRSPTCQRSTPLGLECRRSVVLLDPRLTIPTSSIPSTNRSGMPDSVCFAFPPTRQQSRRPTIKIYVSQRDLEAPGQPDDPLPAGEHSQGPSAALSGAHDSRERLLDGRQGRRWGDSESPAALFGHTLDPLGSRRPRAWLRAFRSYINRHLTTAMARRGSTAGLRAHEQSPERRSRDWRSTRKQGISRATMERGARWDRS
jgi:hypothetical protein